MRFLLDENFPLGLLTRLRTAGHEAEHIITLEQRGVPDDAILKRLDNEDGLVLLTQDTEFLDTSPQRGAIILSRVPQHLPISIRIALWFDALERFVATHPDGALFELLETGEIVRSQPKGNA